MTISNRRELVLAALSTADRQWWTPVQVQKIFFLLDKKLGGKVGGPYFDFQPYDYGPFDANVYRAIEALEPEGFAEIDKPEFSMSKFRLTAEGEAAGKAVLASLPEEMAGYIGELSQWLRGLNFPQLVSAIYAEFPDMRARSVFRD